MPVIRQHKVDEVNNIKDRIQDSEGVFFVNFRGLTVVEVDDLRKSLREAESSAVVCKNTLARIALSELSISYPEEFLIGPSMIVGTDADVAKTSKVLAKFNKEVEAFELKGGILSQSKVMSIEEVVELSKLPSREELIAKVIGGIKGPLTGFHAAISGPVRGLAYALKAVQDKNQEVQ